MPPDARNVLAARFVEFLQVSNAPFTYRPCRIPSALPGATVSRESRLDADAHRHWLLQPGIECRLSRPKLRHGSLVVDTRSLSPIWGLGALGVFENDIHPVIQHMGSLPCTPWARSAFFRSFDGRQVGLARGMRVSLPHGHYSIHFSFSVATAYSSG